jgi:hypothetical protein
VALMAVSGGGFESVSGKDEADPRKSKDNRSPAATDDPARPRKTKAAKDVSTALRTVYDDTLREDIPDDFRDLLDKLR